MKKILIFAIAGILSISLVQCNGILNKQDSKANDSEIVSQDESSNANDKSSDDESDNKIIDKNIPVEDATDININIKVATVTIRAYEGEDVKITGELSEKSKGVNLNKSGKKIDIIEERDELEWNNKFNFENEKGSKFDILIPLKFNGNFTFKQGVGKTNIDGLIVNQINISGGTGKIECGDIKFDKLNLNSGVGEIDLDLKEKCGDVKIAGGVGKININMEEVGGNLTYKGGVGEADIKIPKNSPVKIIKGNGMGKYNISAQTSEDGNYIFDLKTGVGSINVHN